MIALLALCALIFATTSTAHAFESVRIQVLDRGQADGIVVRTPNSKWIVIDGGTNSQQAVAMENMGVDRVALAIVSHRHFDHNGGMDSILEKIAADRFLGINDDCPKVKSDDNVRDQITAKGIPLVPLDTAPIVIDGVKFTVLPLLPDRKKCPNHENDNSIVVRIDFGDFSMLFTGDAEDELRDFLVANHSDLLDVDVLKAAHHGANNGTSASWLAAVSPERVVISAGVNSNHKHPRAGAVAAYIAATSSSHVYCTNRHKTIRIYGRRDGSVQVTRQNKIDKSCVYDGTHY